MKDIKIHNYQTASKYTYCSDTRAKMTIFLIVSVCVHARAHFFCMFYRHFSCMWSRCMNMIQSHRHTKYHIYFKLYHLFTKNGNKNGFCIAYQMASVLGSNSIATILSSTTMKAISFNKYINRISHESFVCW